MNFKMSSTVCFNLDQSKILSSVKELNIQILFCQIILSEVSLMKAFNDRPAERAEQDQTARMCKLILPCNLRIKSP